MNKTIFKTLSITILLILVLFGIVSLLSSAFASVELHWAKRAGGVSNSLGYRISSFIDGSVIITGYFENTSTFGTGEPNQTSLISAGSRDVFIAKYNANGTLAWAKKAGGASIDIGRGIATLSDGSAIVSGHFSDISTFGAREPNQTSLTSSNNYDIFIAKYRFLNDPPTAENTSASTNSNTAVSIPLLSNDPNNDPVSGQTTDIGTITITDTIPNRIQKSNGLKIVIANDDPVIWDESIKQLLLSGTGKNRVDSEVQYSADKKQLILNIKEDFYFGDTLQLSGMKTISSQDFYFKSIKIMDKTGYIVAEQK